MTGLLRKGVKVITDKDFVRIQKSFLEVSLPKEWVDAQPGLWGVLERRIARQNLANLSEELQDVLTLLEVQGCFSISGSKPTYSLKEVKSVFEPICSEWYAEYYSHLLWQRLRDGSLSRNGLVAWLIHNYHISRAAGITEARCSTRTPRPELQLTFQANTLEEYWHCDAFYFVQHPNLSISDKDVKTYIHLPSSLAFEQQMLRMAEEDWLGFVLVSFFQESSIKFYDDFKNFYSLVEKNYEIEDFFQLWMQHIELDFKHAHAANLAIIFDSDESISLNEVLRSLYNAWFAFKFLLKSLDEILDQEIPENKILLRKPICGALLNSKENGLLKNYQLENTINIKAQTALETYSQLSTSGICFLPTLDIGKVSQLPDIDARYLLRELTKAFFKCLGYATQHDEVVLYGRLAQKAFETTKRQEDVVIPYPQSPLTVALANFFNESAIQPLEFAFLCYHAYNLESRLLSIAPGTASFGLRWIPIESSGKESLESFLGNKSTSLTLIDHLSNLTLQFNEFYFKWLLSRDKFYEIDFFES